MVRNFQSAWAGAYNLFDTAWGHAVIQPARQLWNRTVAAKFLASLRASPPSAIVTTHFFPADVAATAKRAGWLKSPLIVVITDLAPHRFWLAPQADLFVVATPRTAEICEARGVPRERLRVIGIPVAPRFANVPSQADAVTRLGLDPSRRTVLLASGGMGVGPLPQLLRAMLGEVAEGAVPTQFAVICGENRELAEQLHRQTRDAPAPVRVLGFVDNMPEWMAAADIMVTKAGGLTITEALAVGVPMVLTGNIPGQEQMNAEYAARHGAAVSAQQPIEAARLVAGLLRDAERLDALRRAARRLGRPDAANEIARLVLDAAAAA